MTPLSSPQPFGVQHKAMADISIRREIVISWDGCTKPWYIQRVQVVQGHEFLQLQKRDTGFARFVTGDCKGMRHTRFLDTLRRKRTEASLLCCSEASLFDSIPTKAARVQQKRKCVEAKTRGEMPETCMIDLPGFYMEGVGEVSEITMRVLTSVDMNTAVSVEMTSDNLAYIRNAMRADAEDVVHRSRASSFCKGVRWDGTRKAFMAKRKPDGDRKYKYRTFRPTDPDQELDCAAAQDRAIRWVDEGSDADEQPRSETDDQDTTLGDTPEQGDSL